jgi:histidyl-tRNA synthetase
MDVSDWQGFKELQQLVEGLEGLGKLQRCIYDLSIVRGIGYYDGIVFEGYDRVGEDIGSIFGGGRYDKLCSLYGKRDMPATGVAGGIERMLLSLERAGVIPKSPVADGVFVAFAGNLDARKRLSFVARLRSHGVSADYDLKAHGLGKQLEYADAARFAFAMIVGPREMERGMVKLRDMISRTEREMGFDEALSMLKR